MRHARAHLTRAVLEGVAFGLRDSFELMKAAGLRDVAQVRIAGGGARSPLWRQILADVLKVELVTVNTTEGAAFGAALLAAVGAGAYPNVAAAAGATIQRTGSTAPRSESARIYDDTYALYRDLYPALRQTFVALGNL